MTRRVLVGSGSLAALGARSRGRAAGLERVNFASVNATSDAGVFLADDLGFFAEQGIDIQYTVIGTSPMLITAAITSQVDIAGPGITPGLFAAAGRGVGVKIAGDKQSVRPGFSNTRFVVRMAAFTGDKAESIARLRGKTLGISSRGSASFYLMAKTLAKHGIGLDDVRIVEMEFANLVVALGNGAIEGGMLLDPYLTKAVRGGGAVAVEVSDSADVVPGGRASLTAAVFSEQFVAKRELAQRWMLAYVKGVRAYNDAFIHNRGRERVFEIIAAHTHIDRALVADGFPVGLDPDQRISLAMLEEYQEFFMQIGLLRQKVDVAGLVDGSFAERAVAELGPYRG